MWRAHGDVFSFRLGPKHCLGVADPALVRSIMRERPHDFTRMSTMESTARELGMHGVFSAEGEDWKRQRTLIMPAFRDSHLLQRFDTLRAITERLMSSLAPHAASGEPALILDQFMRYTVDVTNALDPGKNGWFRDRSFLPWADRQVGATSRAASEACRKLIPGLLLFRNSDLENPQVLMVLVVGETPTIGLHRAAFSNALRIASWVRSDKKAALSIVGPTFSGSAYSLRVGIEAFTAQSAAYVICDDN